MKIIYLGIDLAKNVFAVHGIDESGKGVLVRPNVRRDQLVELIATLQPCVIGMEACSGAHHWARTFAGFGHTPKLMAPKFVAPYRMSGRRAEPTDGAGRGKTIPIDGLERPDAARRSGSARAQGWASLDSTLFR